MSERLDFTKPPPVMDMHALISEHAPRERMAARLAELSVRPDTPCHFFGCIGSPGHYLWTMRGRAVTYASIELERSLIAIFGTLDGALCWNGRAERRGWGRRDETEGRAFITHRDGWTALAFWDRSVDKRGACNSAFLAPGTLTYKQIARLARYRWPQVWERFGFPVVEVDAAGNEVT